MRQLRGTARSLPGASRSRRASIHPSRPRGARAAVTFRRTLNGTRSTSGSDDSMSWPAALAFVMLSGVVFGDPAPIGSHVRAANAQIRGLIDDSAARSAIVRDLLARLGCSDVIVYVEMTASPEIPRGRTKLVTASPGVRFLRIGINRSMAGTDLPALLAHELQHAVEIAERDEVRDDEGVPPALR